MLLSKNISRPNYLGDIMLCISSPKEKNCMTSKVCNLITEYDIANFFKDSHLDVGILWGNHILIDKKQNKVLYIFKFLTLNGILL